MILSQLEEEHRRLDEEIKRYEEHPNNAYYLSTHITDLKKKKLALRDRIEYYRHITT